ncbi:MAG: hypothetical protein IJ917_01350 [Firmicutes bacterium]|nr:hypothetical protein [Bacillota bacterium]
MLSREKIRMMAQAAVYEKSYYRKDMFVERYFKNDYIGLERLKTKIWMTVFFAMYVAAYIFDLVYIEQIDLLHFNYKQFAVKAIIVYLVLSVIISVLTSAVYGPKYERANRRMKAYYDQLEKINLKG